MTGDAFISRSGNEYELQPLEKNQPILEKDLVVLADKAQANMRFRDGSEVYLYGEARLRLEGYSEGYEPLRRTFALRLRLLDGAASVRISNNLSDFSFFLGNLEVRNAKNTCLAVGLQKKSGNVAIKSSDLEVQFFEGLKPYVLAKDTVYLREEKSLSFSYDNFLKAPFYLEAKADPPLGCSSAINLYLRDASTDNDVARALPFLAQTGGKCNLPLALSLDSAGRHFFKGNSGSGPNFNWPKGGLMCFQPNVKEELFNIRAAVLK